MLLLQLVVSNLVFLIKSVYRRLLSRECNLSIILATGVRYNSSLVLPPGLTRLAQCPSSQSYILRSPLTLKTSDPVFCVIFLASLANFSLLWNARNPNAIVELSLP